MTSGQNILLQTVPNSRILSVILGDFFQEFVFIISAKRSKIVGSAFLFFLFLSLRY